MDDAFKLKIVYGMFFIYKHGAVTSQKQDTLDVVFVFVSRARVSDGFVAT